MSTYRKVRKETAERMGSTGSPMDALDDLGRRIWCTANGCPNRASVYIAAPVCSWHKNAKPNDWPAVTEELIAMLAEGEIPQRPPMPQSEWVKAALAEIQRSKTPVADVWGDE